MRPTLSRRYAASLPRWGNFLAIVLSCGFLFGIARAAQWNSTTPLPDGYWGHALVNSSGFLYQTGGASNTNGVPDGVNVFYAQANSDGSVGAWKQGTSLPEPVFWHAGVAWNKALYVIGGYHVDSNGNLVDSPVVYFSRLNADGSPGPWMTTTPLPQGLFLHSAAVWNGTIYVTGGWSMQGLANVVYAATANTDGTLGAWATMNSLPQGVYAHATVQDGTLYVLGGAIDNGNQLYNGVYFAPINSDKTIGAWGVTSPLPEPVVNHVAVVVQGSVYVAGGFDGNEAESLVWTSAVLSSGTLGPWAAGPSMPHALYMHAGTVVNNNIIFLTGGQDTTATYPSVYSLVLPPPPAPPPPPPPAQPQDVLPPRTTLAVGAPQYGASPLFASPATPFSLSAVDDATTVGDGAGVGVAARYWSVDSGSFSAYAGPFTVSPDGLHWVRYYSVDKVGNAETVRASSVAVDGTPPVSGLSVGSPQAVLASGAVVVSSRTLLDVTAQDPVVNGVASGLSSALMGVDGGTMTAAGAPFALPPADGPHVVRMQAADNLGNLEVAHSSTVYLDQTPPATTIAAAPAPYVAADGGAYLGAGSLLSFQAQDPVVNGVASGWNHTEYAVDGGSFSLVNGALGLTEGAHLVAYRSVDNVGNMEATKTAAYRVDLTPPLSTLAIGSPSVEVFNAEVISPQTPLTITAQDPVSNGVASLVRGIFYSVDGGADQAYNGPITLPAGSHTLSYGAVDNAGNAEARRSVSVIVGSFLTQDAIDGLGSVTLSGRASVTGDVRVNGPFEADGGSNVTGNVWAMSSTLTGKSAVGGTVTQGAATVPTAAFDFNAARTWIQANNNDGSIPPSLLSNGALTMSGGSLALPAGNYYLTGLALSGQASVTVSGSVFIFLDGPLSVGGGAQANSAGDAASLWFFSASGDVSLSGTARAAFNLYAPRSAVAVSGGGQFAGRILGNAVTLTGGALQPSTTALPAHARGPGPAVHAGPAGSQPGRGTTARATRDGREEAVLSNSLQARAPASGSGAAGSSAVDWSRLPAAPSTAAGPGSAAAPGAAPLQTRRLTLPAVNLSTMSAFSFVHDDGAPVRTRSGSGVVVPAGALSSGLGISVAPDGTADPQELARRQLATARRAALAYGRGVEFGPTGTRFKAPVTLELSYDRSKLPPGVSESQLAIHYWNPATADWEPLASQVDAAGQVVRAQTTHFSLYQILAVPLSSAPAPSPSADAASLPFAFAQVYAYPNPARGGRSPTIHVEAGSATSIDIRIYDISGQRRFGASLAGPQSAFEQTWNVSGEGSGVYIYTVTAHKGGEKDIAKTGKLAVIK